MTAHNGNDSYYEVCIALDSSDFSQDSRKSLETLESLESWIEIFTSEIMDFTREAVEILDSKIIIRTNKDAQFIDALLAHISDFSANLGVKITHSVEIKQNKDWIAEYKKSIKPLVCGRFYIYPPWEKSLMKNTRILDSSANSVESLLQMQIADSTKAQNWSLQGKAKVIQQDLGKSCASNAKFYHIKQSEISNNLSESKISITPPLAPPLTNGKGELSFSLGCRPLTFCDAKSKQKTLDSNDSRESKNFCLLLQSKSPCGLGQRPANSNTSPSLWEGARGWASQNKLKSQNPTDSRESKTTIDCHESASADSRNDSIDSIESSESNKIFRLSTQKYKTQDSRESQNLGKSKKSIDSHENSANAQFIEFVSKSCNDNITHPLTPSAREGESVNSNVCEALKPSPKFINILLEPSLAFGTGHHASTFMCIEALDALDSRDLLQHKKLLDFGCGSGILALCAAKLGAIVDLCDIDELAILESKKNFNNNNAKIAHIWQGGIDSKDAQNGARREIYDIIVANIIASVLIEQKDNIDSALKCGGIAILSGILDIYKDEVLAQFADFMPLAIRQKDEWICAILQKPKN